MTVVRAWRSAKAYFAHREPRTALSNTVAMIVLGNQPLYPAYVWYAAGAFVPASLLIWLSLPLYAAAPAVSRRAASLGRAMLLTAAVGNTCVSTLALGPASGVELFYGPCLLVAWAISAPGCRARPVAATVCGVLGGGAIGRALPTVATLSPAQDMSLWRMNLVSVLCLCAVVALQAWRIARTEAAFSRSG